jgi:hypothetical protein
VFIFDLHLVRLDRRLRRLHLLDRRLVLALVRF